ncbi:MAG: transcription antitermination factor NusB [Eubacteriales bacterium]|nr:transcription antitermination factor NusB [Eubacteriales bacterium]
MSRKRAREAAFLLLFEWEANKAPEKPLDDVLKNTVEFDNLTLEDLHYIEQTVSCCKEMCAELDAQIAQNSQGWRLERLPKVDLALLRLAIYEMKCRDDIPDAVSINECINLAKTYSTDKSGAYINGVLSTVEKENQGGVDEERHSGD